ncbi:unnamed protein product [Oppiella nova]|uniref:Uncharacterized protein n=1 Tax=Oppiella nova TaxID=334625 RepID=A0A7R9MVF8_9ACAR|nr:unnamed protein product [Oppiella nova]CAD7668869.1 unnamed protein product [Oppiella nova]CAG2184317.1 unnamed protein product [Oppiella nova]CAG2184318.1 unnamed protein product [Oppiella nova]
MAKSDTRIGLLSVNENHQKMRIIVNTKQLIIEENCHTSDHNVDNVSHADHSDDQVGVRQLSQLSHYSND